MLLFFKVPKGLIDIDASNFVDYVLKTPIVTNILLDIMIS